MNPRSSTRQFCQTNSYATKVDPMTISVDFNVSKSADGGSTSAFWICAIVSSRPPPLHQNATPFSSSCLLDNLMIYWVTSTGALSARLYWERIEEIHAIFDGTNSDTIDVPVGATIFPKEIPRISRRWAERRFTNIVQWREHEQRRALCRHGTASTSRG